MAQPRASPLCLLFDGGPYVLFGFRFDLIGNLKRVFN